jgi:hypothetical protein
MHRSSDVTALLKAWRGGDQAALERLTPLVYDHLRKLGRQYLRKERADARADATSLVHQAYVRLVDARAVDWQDRAHFFAVSSTIMRGFSSTPHAPAPLRSAAATCKGSRRRRR